MATFGRGLRQVMGTLRSRIGEHGVAPWVCPECGEAALRRSHAVSWVEHVGRAVRLRVYRCHGCQHRQFHLGVASADEMARRAAVPAPQPRPKREPQALAVGKPVAVAVAGSARGAGDLARRLSRQIRLRTLVVVSLLVALLGGGGWAVASHRLELWQRGKEALSVGHDWWTGTRVRVSAVVNDLKLAASPAPAPAPVAATEPAPPPKKKRPPARRRTHTVAKAGANAAAVARASAAAVPTANTVAPAREGAVGGVAWRAARWGMTVEEVLAAFPSEAVRSGGEASFSSPLAERVAIGHARLGAVTATVSFLFGRDGKLAAIATKPDATGGDSDRTYRELAQWVVGEIGTPIRQESRVAPSGSRIEASAWRTPDTAVHLSLARTVARDARILTLDLGSGDIQVVPQGIELWYEPTRPIPGSQRGGGAPLERDER